MTDTKSPKALTSQPWLQPVLQSPPLRFIRKHPFSTMALCNIIGDLGYLGFSVEAHHHINMAKLAGAACTIPAHIILLAYGDADAARISAEHGLASQIILSMRKGAKALTHPVRRLIVKPQAISFGILTGNGVGLITDAAYKLAHHGATLASGSQIATGLSIIAGCGLFAVADLVKNQNSAERLQKTAPKVLLGTTALNFTMAGTTLLHSINPGGVCMAIGSTAFLVSNIAGFFTKIDKGNQARRPKPQSPAQNPSTAEVA